MHGPEIVVPVPTGPLNVSVEPDTGAEFESSASLACNSVETRFHAGDAEVEPPKRINGFVPVSKRPVVDRSLAKLGEPENDGFPENVPDSEPPPWTIKGAEEVSVSG